MKKSSGSPSGGPVQLHGAADLRAQHGRALLVGLADQQRVPGGSGEVQDPVERPEGAVDPLDEVPGGAGSAQVGG